MNVRASELKPGMLVLRGMVATPDSWVELADPPVEWSPSGSWVELLYVDGSRSQPMQAVHLVEIRSAPSGPVR